MAGSSAGMDHRGAGAETETQNNEPASIWPQGHYGHAADCRQRAQSHPGFPTPRLRLLSRPQVVNEPSPQIDETTDHDNYQVDSQ